MTLIQLQYVLAIAEYRNFTLAAQRTHVTQPTLSMQIQKLEDELEVQIFDRTKKPIGITDFGEKIIKQARKIVDESERMRDVVDQEKSYVGGLFRLGMIPTVMPTLLPMFLKSFVNRYPKVNLRIEECNTQDLIYKLQEGHLDAAIAATPLEVENIKERVLYYEPFVAYIPEGHRLWNKEKLTVEDLELQEVLLLEDGHCFRDGVLNLCRPKGEKLLENFQLESGSFETLVRLVDEGLGMTLLPYLNTLDLKEGEKKKLRYFIKPSPARETSLIYRKSELKLQIIDALAQVIYGVVRGAIAFQDVKIVSPLNNRPMKGDQVYS